MMNNSNQGSIIDEIIAREGDGKYTNDPKDSGGPTRWGITEKEARSYGYTGDMMTMPRSLAVQIYNDRYWISPGFGGVATIYPQLAVRLADFGVLAGPTTASKMLQRCLNVLNQNAILYPDMPCDGNIGGVTLSALKQYLKVRGDVGKTVLLGMVVSLQSAYLIELAERRPKDEAYQFGWQLNRAIGSLLIDVQAQ